MKKEEKVRRCPNCGKIITDPNLRYCPYCGEIFTEEVTKSILKRYGRPLLLITTSIVLLIVGTYLMIITVESSIVEDNVTYIVKVRPFKNIGLMITIIGAILNILGIVWLNKRTYYTDEKEQKDVIKET